MIEQLYLDLAEETNETKIYGKLFQDCKAAAEELFRVKKVIEPFDLQDNGTEIRDSFYCLVT